MYLKLVTDQTEESAASVTPLEATLVDLLDLSIQAEQAHWALTGPGARGIHLCLNQLVDQYRDWHEEVVARLGDLGASTNGRIAALAAATPLELLPEGRLSDRAVVAFFLERIDRLVARVRARVAVLGDRDPVSHGLLVAIDAWLEMQAVFLRAQPSYRRHATASAKSALVRLAAIDAEVGSGLRDRTAC